MTFGRLTGLPGRPLRALLTAVGLALIGFGPAPAQAATLGSDYSAVDRYVQSQADANYFPGTSVAVVEGDRLAYARGVGHDADGQAVTPQTPFMIGSNSKSFTALAVMQLVEAGKVELDAPVQRYVPGFQLADPAAAAAITVRQLLTHTGGLPTSAGGEIPFGVRPASFEEGLAALRSVHLASAPGTTFQYSNAGYMLLGRVVEVAAQEPYAAYVQQHILQPLDMANTRLAPDGIAGYRYVFGATLPYAMSWAADGPFTAVGGVVSTAEDMSHYLSMYLGHGQYNGRTLLSAAGIAEMQRGVQHVALREGGENVDFDVAMGWIVGHVAGVPATYHIGGAPNFSSWMVILPEENRALITLTNVNNWVSGPGTMAFERIPVGIVATLAGTNTPSGMTLPTMYLAVDVIAALIVGLQLWSLWRLARRPFVLRDHRAGRWPKLRQASPMLLPLLWEFGLGQLLREFPSLQEVATWRFAFDYTPDFAALALAIAILWMLTGGVRILKFVLAMRMEAATAQRAGHGIHRLQLRGHHA